MCNNGFVRFVHNIQPKQVRVTSLVNVMEEQPPLKKAKHEFRKNRRHRVDGVHRQLLKHKSLVYEALDQLNSDWTYFCFVKILNCNADESCSFSGAYCKTMRNCQDEDVNKRRVIWMPDLSDVSLVRRFLDRIGDTENDLLHRR